MGTHCTIAILNANGTVSGVYVQWDGDISYTGVTLRDHYNTEPRVRELLSHGDMSCIGKNIHPDPAHPHTFRAPQNDVCVFYARDRGENGVSAVTFDNWASFKMKFGQMYDYLFVPGKGWIVDSAFGESELLKEAPEAA